MKDILILLFYIGLIVIIIKCYAFPKLVNYVMNCKVDLNKNIDIEIEDDIIEDDIIEDDIIEDNIN